MFSNSNRQNDKRDMLFLMAISLNITLFHMTQSSSLNHHAHKQNKEDRNNETLPRSSCSFDNTDSNIHNN